MSRDAYACKLTMHFPTLDNLPRSLYIGNRRKPNLAAFRWGPHPGVASGIHGPRRAL